MIVAAVATVAATTAGAAEAAPAPRPTTSGSADFSVSGPAEPITPGRDGLVHTQLTVSNNGVHALTVPLRSIGVRPSDDGRVQLTDQGDPLWAAATALPPALRLAANSFRRVPVTIRVPAGLLPDLYLLGFVAEAQPIDPNAPVRIYHRICTLITVELDGARERALAAMVKPAGFLRIGSDFEGAFRVTNVGTAAAMARSQVLVTSALSSEGIGMVRTSDAMELIPSGTSRNVSLPGARLFPVRAAAGSGALRQRHAHPADSHRARPTHAGHPLVDADPDRRSDDDVRGVHRLAAPAAQGAQEGCRPSGGRHAGHRDSPTGRGGFVALRPSRTVSVRR